MDNIIPFGSPIKRQRPRPSYKIFTWKICGNFNHSCQASLYETGEVNPGVAKTRLMTGLKPAEVQSTDGFYDEAVETLAVFFRIFLISSPLSHCFFALSSNFFLSWINLSLLLFHVIRFSLTLGPFKTQVRHYCHLRRKNFVLFWTRSSRSSVNGRENGASKWFSWQNGEILLPITC